MENVKILLVEDEKIVARDIENSLNELGYEVLTTASTGEEAIKKTEETQPHLVLMDIELKGDIDGIEVAEQIRNFFNIPVVFISAYADKKTLERAKLTEPFGFIIKPYEKKELYTSIVTALYKHKIETALRESEKKYRMVFETAADVIVLIDKKGIIIDCNKQIMQILGYRPDEITGKSINKIIHPASLKQIRGILKELFSVGFSINKEFKMIQKNGKVIDAKANCSGIKDESGVYFQTICIIDDITKRKQAERELRNRSHDLSERVKELRCLYQIDEISRKKRFTVEEFLKKTVQIIPSGWQYPKITGSCITFQDKKYETKNFKKTKWTQKVDIVIKNKKAGLIEVCYLEEKPESDEGLFLKEERNLLNAIAKRLGQTIEQKRGERELKESEMRFRSIFENVVDGIILTDMETKKFFTGNKKVCQMLGYDREELKNLQIEDIHPKKDVPFVLEQLEKQRKGEITLARDIRVRRKNGVIFYADVNSSPITLDNRTYLMGIFRDISRRKQAEKEKEKLQAQLIHSEKMAGIGTLASGIAHEFNNILQIISGIVQFAQKTKKPKDAEEAFNTVIDTSKKAADIIKDLLAFSSPSITEKKMCYVTEPIESVLSLLEIQLNKQNIRVVRKYEETLPTEQNKTELQTVFFNLIINAGDSMAPEGGALEIHVLQVNGQIEVRFSDTGKGIAKENLSRVFEPFYTTKGPRGGTSISGTGLGLSVSYGIIQKNGGTIEVQSKKNKGATFIVKLPLTEQPSKRKKVETKIEKEGTKFQPLNILVVDDEEEICKVLNKFLSSKGHNVRSVLEGKKALEIIKKEKFHVLLLDLLLPGISGIKILEEIKKVSPKTKVLIMTGKLIDKDLSKELKRKGAWKLIQKPFKIEDILRASKL